MHVWLQCYIRFVVWVGAVMHSVLLCGQQHVVFLTIAVCGRRRDGCAKTNVILVAGGWGALSLKFISSTFFLRELKRTEKRKTYKKNRALFFDPNEGSGIIYRVLYIPGGWPWGFLNHQQYLSDKGFDPKAWLALSCVDVGRLRMMVDALHS